MGGGSGGGDGERGNFSGRAANAGFALQTWNDVFSRWFPSLTHGTTVKVNGGKLTPNNDVVHAALSIAFGSMRSVLTTTTSFSNFALIVKNDPIQNVCVVSFATTNASAIYAINMAANALGFIIGEAIRGIKSSINPFTKDEPGLAERGPDGQTKIDKFISKLIDRLGNVGLADSAYDIGQEEIIGWEGPPLVRPVKEKRPFNEMKYKLWLTRLPATNPKPPAYDGTDLRTLVAQVLHDPGVRPPLPKTDKGRPTVFDELKAKAK